MLSARLAGKACALLFLAACAQTRDADLASPSVDTEVNIEPTTQASIDRAMLAVKAAEVAPVPFGDCASPDLERLLSGLQPVERDADAAVDAALASTGVAEREAALNQADSLHGLAIDGYMSFASKYSAAGCLDRARWIYSEISRVYTGDAFATARNEAKQRVQQLGGAVE